MKVFTVAEGKPVTISKIHVNNGFIICGETGSSTSQQRVPLIGDFGNADPHEYIYAADVAPTTRGFALVPPTGEQEENCVVNLVIPYSHRGGGTWYSHGASWATLVAGGKITVLGRGTSTYDNRTPKHGVYPDLLILLAQNVPLVYERSGRLYGAPKKIFVLWNGSDLLAGTEDEVLPATLI